MFNASTIRNSFADIRESVTKSAEFKQILTRLEKEFCDAAAAGLSSYRLKTYLLPVFANYRLPKNVCRDLIDDVGNWWWPFVEAELVNRDFKILPTNTVDHYAICW